MSGILASDEIARISVGIEISGVMYPKPLEATGEPGSYRWMEGRCFGLWLDVMILSNMIYLFTHNPALLAEGAKTEEKGCMD
jgi:hypothetical protein